MEGRKDDHGKLRYDLIPPCSFERLAEVYTLGARKYGDHNWRKGMAWGRVYAAALRHLTAWAQGRTVDPDDRQHPLASVAWCCFTLMEYERLGLGVDDIRQGKTWEEIAEWDEEQVEAARAVREFDKALEKDD